MNPHLQRAQLLMGQGRFEPAREHLMRALGDEPNDAQAHALLALCLAEGKQDAEALREAQYAVHLEPGHPLTHYILARVHVAFGRHEEALRAAQEAIRIDPEDPDLHAQVAGINLARGKWREALEASERGLALDAEHTDCTNLRAVALTQLGRRDEAGAGLRTALGREPDNALSHANLGWTLLHQGQPRPAMEHFREALRLDPNLEWAREGIVEALKAHNFVYRQLLRYFLWMSRLSPGVRVGVVIGVYFVFRLLRTVARERPEWTPYVLPLIVVYIGFVLLTWTAGAVFNLLLRLHPLGKHALSAEERRASNFVGAFLAAGLVLAVVGFVLPSRHLLVGAGFTAAMILPVSGVYLVPAGKRRKFLAAYTAVLLLILMAGLITPPPAAWGFFAFQAFGIMLFTWLGAGFSLATR